MPDLKIELLSGVADFRSVLHDLDGCLSRLVSAEDALQKQLQRIPRFEEWPRFENWIRPRRMFARLRALKPRGGLRPPIGRRFTTDTLQLVNRVG